MEKVDYTSVSLSIGRKARFDNHPLYDQRACKDVSIDVFFPNEHSSRARRNILDKAARICGSCVVRAECLQVAIANDEQDGFFGGRDFYMPPRARSRNNDK